jgi:type IV pilus assembly protein PilE
LNHCKTGNNKKQEASMTFFNNRQLPKLSQGFSLLELMITIAIIGILASAGSISYQSQVKRGLRTEAQTAMMEIAAKQEQYMMNNQVYANNLTISGLNYTLPASINENYIIATYPYGTDPQRFYIYALPKAGSQMVGDLNMYVYSYGYKYPQQYWGQ